MPLNEKKAKKLKSEISKKANAASGFPIVGIGASAGGLEALESFFSNLPLNSGIAFVIIQHLDPTRIALLPELLQRVTTIKVIQATDGLKLRPNCIYVIPPNKSMSLLNGTLILFEPVEARGLRLPVDIFFRALAAYKKEKSIGIILSGMGSDGSAGVKAIKEMNGIILVQDPEESRFDSMPRNTIESVQVDIIAPSAELPAKLLAYLSFVPKKKEPSRSDLNNNNNLGKIVILLRDKSGHDFSLYKKNTLFRRIERRMGVHQIEGMHNYVRFLQENPNELEILFKELLIGVTSFFRDPLVWENLKKNVLPAYLASLPEGYTIRAWVPGCSTGEEAYSLAMIIVEAMDRLEAHKRITLQIFATDLDQDAIEIARKGLFSLNIASDVSSERLSRFFKESSEGFRVHSAIRELIVFAPQNVIKDAPFTKLDLLTCRNMLIYMEPELQKKMMALFAYSLNPGGIMILGSAESPGNHHSGFIALDPKLKLYKRDISIPRHDLIDFPSSFHYGTSAQADKAKSPAVVENIQSITDQILLQRFSPASVLVNLNGDIIYITGRTGKFLEPAAGKANLNIYAMAREGLRHELPAAFRKAMLSYDPIKLENIIVGTNGGSQLVDVIIQRLEKPDAVSGMILVVFNEVQVTGPAAPILPNSGGASKGRLRELELEIQRSHEDLQSTREEMQTSQEELKSTNEELQSTNEELTTSKEEMQSLNEELQTVNLELQSKINEFVQTNDDMKNMLNSTEIATLFLDKDLNIRRFTDSATNIFKLRKSDIGRPFTDLVNDLQYPQIEQDARQVIKTLISFEISLETKAGAWFNIRIMPYRTINDHIDGLVMTFTDITKMKQIQNALMVTESMYKSLFESAKDGIIFLDAHTGMVLDVNPYLVELTGYPKEHFIKKIIWEIQFLQLIIESKSKFLELQNSNNKLMQNVSIKTASGKVITIDLICNNCSVQDTKLVQLFVHEAVGKQKKQY